MPSRANNLRNIVVDSLSYALLMTLAATAATIVAQGAEPAVVHVDGAATENRSSDDHVDSRLNTDDNPPSGIPEESPAAKREAMMLGMTLYERSEGNVEVVDVAAASPAWDAGIRKRDRIREIDGVKPRSLAGWVEDIGKILKDTEDGHAISAEVERDGETLSVRIKLPISNVAAARDARKADEELARMQAREQRQSQRGRSAGTSPGYGAIDRNDHGYGPAYGGYGPAYGGYGGWGLGGFFDDGGASDESGGEDRLATSAAAALMAINTLGRGGTQSSGGQVGMAGFQNNGQGVDAMVVVRGLPQGTYQVGIGAGGAYGADANPDFVGPDAGAEGFGLQPALEGTADSVDRGGAFPNQPANRSGAAANGRGPNGNPINPQNPGTNRFPNQQQPGSVPQGNAPTPSAGAAPGSASGGVAAPAAGDGASLANPKHAVLAQQFGAEQTPRPGDQRTVNPPQQPAPNNPATMQRDNRQTMPGANAYDPRDRAEAQRQLQGNNPLGNLGDVPFAQIGTLQVGADGSGQLRNRLEGMSVRNLAGMQVIVQSTNWGGGTANAPRFAQNGAAQNRTTRNDPAQVRAGRGDVQGQPRSFGTAVPGQAPTRGIHGIVAAGTIQLRNSGSATGVNPQSAAGQDTVDEATRREQGRSQISDPVRDFNPSQPLR